MFSTDTYVDVKSLGTLALTNLQISGMCDVDIAGGSGQLGTGHYRLCEVVGWRRKIEVYTQAENYF